MDDNIYRENIGSLRISEEVIATIAKYAASEVSGVSAVKNTSSPIKGLLKNSLNRAINITLNDDIAVIDIYIVVKYGVKIADIALQVQNSVKTAVQNMTSITVSKVNVFITGISFEESNSAD